jgi:hypothetical protein
MIRIDLPPAGWPKSREPDLKVKNRPRNPSSTRKSRNAKMTQKCRTGKSHDTLGQNFSKGVLKNFEKKKIDSLEAIAVRRKEDRKRNPELHISIHCSTLGQKFFYLQEDRKIYSTLHTGANFSIFDGGKLEKFKDLLRVSPKNC